MTLQDIHKEFDWKVIRLIDSKDCLDEKELTIYDKAKAEFDEMYNNTSVKKIKDFFGSGIGIWAWRFARSFANPHKAPNLYKKIYQYVFDYKENLKARNINLD